jgi:hypothetical protein
MCALKIEIAMAPPIDHISLAVRPPTTIAQCLYEEDEARQ